MSQNTIAIASVLALGVLAVVTAITPLAYAQIIIQPPPRVPPNTIDESETETETELEQKQSGVASGEGEVDNCEVMSLNSPTGGTQCTGDTEVP